MNELLGCSQLAPPTATVGVAKNIVACCSAVRLHKIWAFVEKRGKLLVNRHERLAAITVGVQGIYISRLIALGNAQNEIVALKDGRHFSDNRRVM